jgi:hypothetical protein
MGVMDKGMKLRRLACLVIATCSNLTDQKVAALLHHHHRQFQCINLAQHWLNTRGETRPATPLPNWKLLDRLTHRGVSARGAA